MCYAGSIISIVYLLLLRYKREAFHFDKKLIAMLILPLQFEIVQFNVRIPSLNLSEHKLLSLDTLGTVVKIDLSRSNQTNNDTILRSFK